MSGWPRVAVFLGMLVVLLAANGCGKKGPLYLPPPDSGADRPASP